jgi:hypothetical protein
MWSSAPTKVRFVQSSFLLPFFFSRVARAVYHCRKRAQLTRYHFAGHIDDKLARFLEKWFPKETKEKQAYNELERRKELLGEAFVHDTPDACVVM